MNTTEIWAKDTSRLQRIKIVSRLARYVCFIFLTFSIGLFLHSILTSSRDQSVQVDWRDAFLLLFEIVLWLWYWNLARLFRFYERGQIFSADTIRCIKKLGILFVAGWLIGMPMRVSPFHRQVPPPPPPSATVSSQDASEKTAYITRVRIVTHTFREGFFSFDFGTGVDFGLLLGGAVIILVAWIMEEGRKMQEEQELTV
jgi:hypothetical protein